MAADKLIGGVMEWVVDVAQCMVCKKVNARAVSALSNCYGIYFNEKLEKPPDSRGKNKINDRI